MTLRPAGIIYWAIQILVWIIIIDAILTWFPQISRHHPIVAALRRITEPIYRPIRKIIPPEKTGYIDLSPLIAILGLYAVGTILTKVLGG